MSEQHRNNLPDIRAILAEIAQALQAEALARIQERHDWNERMTRTEKTIDAISSKVEAISAKIEAIGAKIEAIGAKIETISEKMELLTADVQTLATNAMSHTDRLNKLEGL